MTTYAVDRISGIRTAIRSPAVFTLQLFAATAMIFPSDMVIKTIGAGGYVAALLAYFLFLYYIAMTFFGLHNPLEYRSPVRIALCTLWLAALASYALMDRTLLNSAQQSSANRWLIQLAGVSGVILVASEFTRSLRDIHRILRALTWGAAFCGIVAALQFWGNKDITPYLKILPAFTINQAVGTIAIGTRGGLNRVAGTASDPIELGVTVGMILPLAVYLAMHDSVRSPVLRWFPVVCIGIAVPISISRSAILSAALAMGVFIVSLPPARRLTALVAIPVALSAVFLGAHRLLGTLKGYFFAGTSDSSISHRVNNLPYVEHLVRQALLFGQGGGTYIAGVYTNLSESHILDDQYLDTAIELGLVGLAALIFYFLWPTIAAFAVRRRSRDPQLRELCAALAGAALAATVCSATFDALSFPMFVDVQALVTGLIGAVWLLVEREHGAVRAASPLNHDNGTRPYLFAGSEISEPGGGR